MSFCLRADGKVNFENLPSPDTLTKKITDFHTAAQDWKEIDDRFPKKPADLRSDWGADGKKGWGTNPEDLFQNLAVFERDVTSSLSILNAYSQVIKESLEKSETYTSDLSFEDAVDLYYNDGTLDSTKIAIVNQVNDAISKYKASVKDIDCTDESLNNQINKKYKHGIIKIGALKGFKDTEGFLPDWLTDSPRTAAEASAASDAISTAVAESATAAASIANEIPKDFKEQCIFLSQIFDFAKFHQDLQTAAGSGYTKKLPYAKGSSTNSSLVVQGKPFGFVNKLTQYADMDKFFEATNAQLAHLQPMIRLFKVLPQGNEEVQVPFKFDTFANSTDVEELFTRKDKRGFGVGIQNFTYVLDGNNPFAVKKSIQANLTIKAANFSELIREREIKGQTFRYVDLALKTGKSIKEKTGNRELDFRIKAVVGIERPNGETTANLEDIENGIKNNFVTLNLTPVTHDFDFDETGAVTFKIEYRAFIEEYFDKARMNIFADPQINKNVIERKLALKTQRKNCTEEDQVKKLNEFIEADGEKVKKDKIDSLKYLTTELNKQNYIYFLSLSQEQFNDMILKGPFVDIGNIAESISLEGINVDTVNTELEEQFNAQYDASASSDNKDLQNSFKLSGIGGRQFAFFYLGDLVDLILEKIDLNLAGLAGSIANSYEGLDIDSELLKKEKEILTNSAIQFKKTRVVLGPIEIVDHRNKFESRNVSFADIPISLNYFNEWLTTKLLAKDSANYPLTQFLNDLMNDLVRNYLNDDSCYSYNIKQKIRVFQSTITSYKQPKQDTDDITKYAQDTDGYRLNIDSESTPQPILNIGGHRNFNFGNLSPDRENHFFVYYAGRVQPKESMTGNRNVDQSRGIFHYILGRDRGIVKNISLSKNEAPGLKEVRFEQEGYDGLAQLREIYDVNISTFANLHAFPGTYIYVDPRGFSPSLGNIDLKKFDLTDLGIGGYYMIINSEHSFEAGVMNSNLTAKWVQSLDADNRDSESDSSSGDGGKAVKKCSVAAGSS